jgi:hypothetical protein
MIDYNLFSQEEAKRLLFYVLELDEKIVDEYLKPRLQLHAEQLKQIIQNEWVNHPEQDKQPKKETARILVLFIAEPMARSQMKRILNTSLNGKEIARKLLPFHREIKEIIEEPSERILESSVPLLQIELREKEPYQQLLAELTQLIRQHSPDADKLMLSQQFSSASPIHRAVEQVQEELIKNELRKEREAKLLVVIKPDYRQKVMDAFLPYVDPEQEQALSVLFTSGHSSETIYFKGSRVALGDFFRRLKDKGILLGISDYPPVAKWLAHYFYFHNKDKKGFTAIKESSILKVLREGDKPKTPIPF